MSTKRETPAAGARRLFEGYIEDGYGQPILHPYQQKDGSVLFYRVRLNHKEREKIVRPMHLDGAHYVLGEGPRDLSEKKLIYKLPVVLGAEPLTPIYIVEGESCVDALSKLGLVATTSGGANSASSADWSALAKRTVIIWPDNDKAGVAYAMDVATQLKQLDASVTVISVDVLGLDETGDAVDWLQAHPKARAKDIKKLESFAPALTLDSHKGEFVLESVPMSNVESKPVRWMWPGKIALGKLTIVAGDPGLGKSMLTADLSARVSTGAKWPDGTEGVSGEVLLVSAEDDPADTIRPRLDTANANPARIHFLTGIRNVQTGAELSFELVDIDALDAFLIAKPDCRLVVIDPLTAYLGGTDSHKNSDVRALLAPLSKLAERHHVSIVVVSHLNKSEGSAMTRTSGSMGFVAAARAAYLVAKDKDDSSRRLFLPIKNNLGKDQTGLSYTIEELEKDKPFVKWNPEPVEITADEALVRESEQDRSELDSCSTWLVNQLFRKSMNAEDVLKLAQAEGYSPRLIRRSREKLGVISKKLGYNKGWLWSLPPEGAEEAPKTPRGKKGPLGALAETKQQAAPRAHKAIAHNVPRKQINHGIRPTQLAEKLPQGGGKKPKAR